MDNNNNNDSNTDNGGSEQQPNATEPFVLNDATSTTGSTTASSIVINTNTETSEDERVTATNTIIPRSTVIAEVNNTICSEPDMIIENKVDNGSPINNDNYDNNETILVFNEEVTDNNDDADENIKEKQQTRQREKEHEEQRHNWKESTIDDTLDQLVKASEDDESNTVLQHPLLPNTTTFAVMNNRPDPNEIIKPGVSYIYPPSRGGRRSRSSNIVQPPSGVFTSNDNNNDNESEYSSDSGSIGDEGNNNNNNNRNHTTTSISSSGINRNTANNQITGTNLPRIDFPTANEMEVSLYTQQLQQQSQTNSVQQSQQPQRQQHEQVRQQIPNTDDVPNINYVITTIAQPVVIQEQSQNLDQYLHQQQQQQQPPQFGSETRPTATTPLQNASLMIAEPIGRDESLRLQNEGNFTTNEMDTIDNAVRNRDVNETMADDHDKNTSSLLHRRANKFLIFIVCLAIIITAVIITTGQIINNTNENNGDVGSDPVAEDGSSTRNQPPPNVTGAGPFGKDSSSRINQPPRGKKPNLGGNPGHIFADPSIVIDSTAPGFNRSAMIPNISYHVVLVEANTGYCRNITTKPWDTAGPVDTTNIATSQPNPLFASSINRTTNHIRVVVQCGNREGIDGREFVNYEWASENIVCYRYTPNAIVCVASLNTFIDNNASTTTTSSGNKSPSSSSTGIQNFTIAYSCATEPPKPTQSGTGPVFYQSTVITDYIIGTSCDPPPVSISTNSSMDAVNSTPTMSPMKPYIKISMNQLCGSKMNNTNAMYWKFHSASTNANSCPYSKWFAVDNTFSNEANTSTPSTTNGTISNSTNRNTNTTSATNDRYTYCEIDSTCQQEVLEDGTTLSTSCLFDQYQFHDDYTISDHKECYNLGGTFIRFVQPDPKDIWNQILSIFEIIR